MARTHQCISQRLGHQSEAGAGHSLPFCFYSHRPPCMTAEGSRGVSVAQGSDAQGARYRDHATTLTPATDHSAASTASTPQAHAHSINPEQTAFRRKEVVEVVGLLR